MFINKIQDTVKPVKRGSIHMKLSMTMTMTTFTKYMWVIDPKVLYSPYTDNSKIMFLNLKHC
jgi:hypothetical protein